MKKMKRLFWLLPVLLTMLVTGCLKDGPNEETIVLMGSEFDVLPVDSVLSDPLLLFLADSVSMYDSILDLNLYKGNKPADIQGEFVFTSVRRFAYNHDPGLTDLPDTLYFRFGGDPLWDTIVLFHAGDTLIQGADTMVMSSDSTEIRVYYPNGQHNRRVPCNIRGDVQEQENGENVYKIKESDAFVMGEGDLFAVYFDVKYDAKEEQSGIAFTLTRGYLITGNLVKDNNDIVTGFDDVTVAYVNKEASNPIQKDNIDVFKYKSAVRKNWYPYPVKF